MVETIEGRVYKNSARRALCLVYKSATDIQTTSPLSCGIFYDGDLLFVYNILSTPSWDQCQQLDGKALSVVVLVAMWVFNIIY